MLTLNVAQTLAFNPHNQDQGAVVGSIVAFGGGTKGLIFYFIIVVSLLDITLMSMLRHQDTSTESNSLFKEVVDGGSNDERIHPSVGNHLDVQGLDPFLLVFQEVTKKDLYRQRHKKQFRCGEEDFFGISYTQEDVDPMACVAEKQSAMEDLYTPRPQKRLREMLENTRIPREDSLSTHKVIDQALKVIDWREDVATQRSVPTSWADSPRRVQDELFTNVSNERAVSPNTHNASTAVKAESPMSSKDELSSTEIPNELASREIRNSVISVDSKNGLSVTEIRPLSVPSDPDGAATRKSFGVSNEDSSTGCFQLAEDFQPTPWTVVVGRDKASLTAPGSRRLHVVVSWYLQTYASCGTDKMTKSMVINEIESTIYSANNGRKEAFVKYQDGRWWSVGQSVAREKIGRILRESLSDLYSSSSKRKRARRRMQRGC